MQPSVGKFFAVSATKSPRLFRGIGRSRDAGNLSRDGPTARRASSGGTAVAMVAYRDLSLIQLHRVEVADMGWRAMVHRQIQHLVEVAVIESAIPAD